VSDGNGIDLRWGVRIPLRDGIHLNAAVYLPKGKHAPSPCILSMTCYVADHLHDRAVKFASRGVPFITVDVRGRGNSAGVFRPNIQEAPDAYDVVEWLAAQPYCNGKVAMYGGSYLGYTQWAAAKELPPHLSTIVPTASPFIGVDFPMRNNIFPSYLVQWLTLVSGHTAQWRVFLDSAYWTSFYRRWYESGKPFRALESQAGGLACVFREWLEHPEPGEYWNAFNPTADQYARIGIPVLTITGIYDDDQPGALEHYKRHVRHATPAGRAQHYLVIGPWDHAGTAGPHADVGGLPVQPAGIVDLHELHLEWYEWTMRNGSKPQFLEKRVAYYVMGAERWRYADTLEAITACHQTFYLESEGRADDVFSSGTLQGAPGSGPPDSYTFDPAGTSGPHVEAEAQVPVTSLVDQRITFALRGKQLVYHSAPFEQDAEISGFFRLRAWISIDCPDTDLHVSVHEITLEGTSIRLSTDAIRARYREGLRTPKPIDTREPLRYDFECFTFVSRQIKRGHRLRLVIAPMGRLTEVMFAQKNYNGGGVVSEESVADTRAVTVRLFHNSDRPSALHVPIGAS
jgi:uncharacterized protein